MEQLKKPHRYSVHEINRVLEVLRREYDLVRLVDVEECRVIEITPDGSIHYLQECFRIWGRGARCENCASYRANHTRCVVDKCEYLGSDREDIHSVPVELELTSGEVRSFVVECVRFSGTDEAGAKAAAERERRNDRSRDVLTRLYTAEKLYREIRCRLLDRPDETYLLVLGNIRNFRLLNKLFGDEGGNRLLVGIGDLLRETCGADAIYGRFRDDRFALITPEKDFDADGFAEKMQVHARSIIDSPVFDVWVKMGIYEITDPNLPVTVMMEHAELAADSIRDDPERMIARFESALLSGKLREQRILADFEEAMLDGEFQIYLQPQVDRDGTLFGAEALVRWVRPEGVMLPGEFLPVLAQSELLSHLDMCVWEQVVDLLGRWRGTALERLSISINVDQSDFYHVDVPQYLSDLCDRYGVERSSLHIEITETALVGDIKRNGRIVEKLHEAGFSVEIDDFGKGSSTLSFLKDIQADVLKIDMGFLQGGSNRDRSRIILKSVINMANDLGMGVITEGVETAEQAEKLFEIGCRRFQGYYFSRPIPVRDFEKVARSSV